MPSDLDLETKFTARIELFFKKRNITLNVVNGKSVIDYLYKQFKDQGRLKDKNKPFYVTPKFVMDGIANFLLLDPSHLFNLFREIRSRRSSTHYGTMDLENTSRRVVTHGLIGLIGRKKNAQYKLTKLNGAPLTPSRVDRIKPHVAPLDISFSPLAPVRAEEKPRLRATSPDQFLFEQDMASSNMALWRMQTPKKNGFFASPHRAQILKPIPIPAERSKVNKQLNFSSLSSSSSTCSIPSKAPELFEFSLTQKEILSRIGAKRPISQIRVMGNISAMEVMKQVGVIVTEKQNGRNFHWAHRRGWSLHGEQVKENLDPMTAGSNYDTLFKIEAPLKKLLLDDKFSEVLVNGEVIFDRDTGLPFKITYRISWGTPEFIKVVIDPMSHRVPTVSEYEVAKTFFGLSTGSLS